MIISWRFIFVIFRGICLCLAPCSQNPYILGPDNANVPKLLAIFAEALKQEALSGSQEVRQRVLAILRHIQVSYGGHVGQCSYPSLTQFTNTSQCQDVQTRHMFVGGGVSLSYVRIAGYYHWRKFCKSVCV